MCVYEYMFCVFIIYIYIYIYIYIFIIGLVRCQKVWGGGGEGAESHNVCTFGKEPHYKRVVFGYMVIY